MKALVIASLVISSQTFAWGPTGHRVVGEIAEAHLSKKAAAAVKKILGDDSLARVSNWADEIRSEPETYSHTYVWHYTEWPDNAHEHTETETSGHLIKSMRDHIATIKDTRASKENKASALKFLVHLVGDLHQPLHVGNGLDIGGNACKVLFHNKTTNLHSLWDEGMIEFTKLSFSELTSYVSMNRTASEIKQWRKGDLLDWAKESKELRAKIYPDEVVASTEPMSVKRYCRRDIQVPQEEIPKLAYEYSYRFISTVEKRLFQAGLRLAELLNQTL